MMLAILLDHRFTSQVKTHLGQKSLKMQIMLYFTPLDQEALMTCQWRLAIDTKTLINVKLK
jgi:hypothetical protein